MRARRALLALGALGASFVAAPARAGVPLDLTWNAPPECPSADAVRSEFERLARLPPGGRTPSRLAAVGDVEARGARWHLRLRTLRDGVAGERELEADSCAALARAAPLVMALALGFDVEAPEPPPAPEPARPRPSRPRVVEAPPPAAPPPPEAPPPPPPPPPPTPVEVVTFAPPPPPPPPTRWSLAVEGRGTWHGPLPGPSLGASLGLDVARGQWLVSIRGDAWWPSDEPTIAGGVRERMTAFGGTASLCATTGERRVILAGCVGARAAAVRAALSNAPIDTPQVAPWLAAVPAVRARVHLFGALHLDAGLELAASIIRPTFTAKNLPDASVPLLVPAAVLGIAADL